MAARRHVLPVATLVVALALLFLLPWFAATVVRGALIAESSADRAAFASGHSPWAWRFHQPDDVVAGRVFGSGSLAAGPSGLTIRASDASGFEVGLPVRRVADLTHLPTLLLEGTASVPGHYALALRQTLDGPGLHASLGTLTPETLGEPIRLDQLPWRDEQDHAVAAPGRAAMLRLAVTLPAGETLSLAGARLVPKPGFLLPPPRVLPAGRSAEGLLTWRDQQRAADPLATFAASESSEASAGFQAAPPPPTWQPWLAPVLYLLLMLVVSLARRQYAIGPLTPRAGFLLLDATLVLAGPLWFIAGLGLSLRPPAPGIAMFAIGVAYALFLTARGRVPRWQALGGGLSAGWPFLALVATLGVVALIGHPPVWPTAGRALLYIGWALFQQWLMLAVFAALIDRALPRPCSLLLTAAAFALLHTPNGVLMQLCFVAELGWGGWYLKHRALLPVALAHAASAVVLQAFVAGGVLRSLEVSARFLG